MGKSELEPLIQQYEALGTIEAQLRELPEGPARDLADDMVRQQEAGLHQGIQALPEEVRTGLQTTFVDAQERLGKLQTARDALVEVSLDTKEVDQRIGEVETELSAPEMRLAQFAVGAGEYAVRFAAGDADSEKQPSTEPEQPTSPVTEPVEAPEARGESGQKPTVRIGATIEDGRPTIVFQGASRSRAEQVSRIYSKPDAVRLSAAKVSALKVLLDHPDVEFTASRLNESMEELLGYSVMEQKKGRWGMPVAIRQFVNDIRFSGQPLCEAAGIGAGARYRALPDRKSTPICDITEDDIRHMLDYADALERTGTALATTDDTPSAEEALPTPEVRPENETLTNDLVALLDFIDFQEGMTDAFAKHQAEEGNTALAEFLTTSRDWLELLQELQAKGVASDTRDLTDDEIIRRRIDTVNSLFLLIDQPDSIDLSDAPEDVTFILEDIVDKLKEFGPEERQLLKEFMELRLVQKIEEYRGSFTSGANISQIGTQWRIGDKTYMVGPDLSLVVVESEPYFEGGGAPDDWPEWIEELGARNTEDGGAQRPAGSGTPKAVDDASVNGTGDTLRPEGDTNEEGEPQPAAVETDHTGEKKQPLTKKQVRAQEAEQRREQQEQQLHECTVFIDGLITTAWEIDALEITSVPQARAAFNIESRDIVNASENGHISRDKVDGGLSLDSIVTIAVLKKYGTSPLWQNPRMRKQVQQIMASKIKRARKAKQTRN